MKDKLKILAMIIFGIIIGFFQNIVIHQVKLFLIILEYYLLVYSFGFSLLL